MPRSSGRSSGGRSAPSGSRGAHTAPSRSQPAPNYPAQQHQPQQHPSAYQQQQQQPRQPGLFANMASTAAGVAVGSSVGHAVSGMLFGGGGGQGGAEPQQAQQQQPPQGYDGYNAQSQVQGAANCDAHSKGKCIFICSMEPQLTQYRLALEKTSCAA